MSTAIVNLITKETSKEKVREVYRDYPQTTPKGRFESFHASTAEPIFCEIPEKSRVLDVGCNDGAMMTLLINSKKCKVTGIDISETTLKIAKSKGLDAFYADAEDMPFEDATFDVVVLREVLVHIHDPLKALSEIRRVLKPNGFLIGSSPHANLERIIWDDKRLHHRYYNETKLKNVLSEVFDTVHLRVLNGAQFGIGFSDSLLSNQPAEMLFKCGGKETKNFDQDLLDDNKTLRVWMGPTQPSGDAYYRMIGYAIKMRQMKGVEVGFDGFSWKTQSGCAEWQDKVRMNPDGKPVSAIALNHLENCLKVADPWIFQLTYYDDIIALFEAAKAAYPKKKLITETDDWIFDIPGYNIASHPYRPNSVQEQIAYDQLKLSDAIIVSTNYLKESLHQVFPDKRVHVIPNSIDFDLWDHCLVNTQIEKEVGKKDEDTVRIIYTGCANHGGDLEIVKPVLLSLLDEYPKLEVLMAEKFAGVEGFEHPRLRKLGIWANIIDYPSMIKAWHPDIGIAPLRDNAFNRSKSNLRWLEYSALHIPTVASDVRPFQESVIHSMDGYLCSTKQHWYTHLKSLIESKKLRSKVGEAAYKRVKKDFNMDDVARQYVKLLKEIRK